MQNSVKLTVTILVTNLTKSCCACCTSTCFVKSDEIREISLCFDLLYNNKDPDKWL